MKQGLEKISIFKISFRSPEITHKANHTSSLGFLYNKISLQSISLYWLSSYIPGHIMAPVFMKMSQIPCPLHTGHIAKVLLLLYWIFLFHCTYPHSRTFFNRQNSMEVLQKHVFIVYKILHVKGFIIVLFSVIKDASILKWL